MSDFLYPLRQLHGNYVEKKPVWKYLNFPIGSKCYVIGTPEHSNIGDSAIVIAEKKFLVRYYGKEKHIKELTFNEYPRYHSLISKLISPNSHFFGMGGEIWEINGIAKKNFVVNLSLVKWSPIL